MMNKPPEDYGRFSNSVDRLVGESLLLAAQMAKIAGDISRARKITAKALRFIRQLKRSGKWNEKGEIA